MGSRSGRSRNIWGFPRRLSSSCSRALAGAAVDPDLLMPAGTRSRWGDRRMPLTLAAGVVAAAVVAAIWWMGTPEVPTYRTDVGGLSRMVLRDGSTVTLNTDTELRVRLS